MPPQTPRTRLLHLLAHCRESVPHFRAALGGADLSRCPYDLLATLPPLTKKEIRADPLAFVARGVIQTPGDRETLERVLGDGRPLENESPVQLSGGRTVVFEKTSGSTGTPFRLIKSKGERLLAGKSVWRLRRAVDPLVRPNTLFPLEHAPPEFSFPYDLGDYSPANVRQALGEIARRRYAWLHGHPQSLKWWAELILEDPSLRAVRFRQVESNGSALLPADREVIEAAFGCPVIDNYNSREFWTIAYECRFQNLHLNDELVVAEVMDGEGEPVTAPGIPGTLLVTSLYLFTLPLVRYALGDRVEYTGRKCACGNPAAALRVVPDRPEDFASGPRGVFGSEVFSKVTRFLYGTYDYHYRQIRVVQEETDAVRVYAADFVGDSDDFMNRFRQVTAALLPPPPPSIHFSFVGEGAPVFREGPDELFIPLCRIPAGSGGRLGGTP